MAKKRGGIAGLYDKSKGFLKVAAPIGLSFIPGGFGIPLAAAAGAALGADKPGSRYGDLGGAVKGGLTGAAIGAGTQGVRGLLTGGGPFGGKIPQLGSGPNKMGASELLKGARENKDLLTMAGKGIMSTMPQPGEDAAMMNAETTRMRFEEEQRQMRMEEERRRRVAELLMPYAQSVYGSLGSRMNG